MGKNSICIFSNINELLQKSEPASVWVRKHARVYVRVRVRAFSFQDRFKKKKTGGV